MSDVRVGIVGAGANTTSKHIPLLQAIDGVEIVGVANRSEASSAAVAKRFGIPKTYGHWEKAVADPDTNAIVIGTWPYLHCPVTLAALDAGKHVLTEARMAMNAGEARRMLDATLAKPGLVAQVVPSPITLFADATIQRLIAEGYLGQLLAVESRIRGGFLDSDSPMHWRQSSELSGNNILAMGIYYEAVMRWVSRATNVMARAKTFTTQRPNETGEPQPVEVPEHLDVVADLECGAQLHLQQSAVTALLEDDAVYLFGSGGMLRLTGDRLFGGRRGDRLQTEISIADGEQGEWQVEADFVAAIRGERSVTHTTFADGVHYMEFTDAVARSIRSGRLEAV
ncbi:MAG: Gfo/Idh/MocA family oxidoreductase [Verrucomicrobiota bacterium]|jgi:predicted dehydrogenase|nr:Gfo/Idh/MocA family oxidoreductase [Verrucomicrobiota bacterium]HJN81795.1 Gfo/Idh/MocA family oxidoreductase [Verrucomicrobiota bacterium]